jgi:hypothetical protein
VRFKAFKLIAVLLALGGVAVTAWWALRGDEESSSVIIRVAGTTNYNERTFVLFAITNRQATNIRGSAFQINETREGWFEAARPPLYTTSPGRRDVWLAPAGTANDGTVIGVIPSSRNTWRMVFGISQGGQRKVPWRDRLTIYLFQHGCWRLAQWVRPRDEKEWTPERFPGEAVLGPKMRGTQRK